MTVYWHFQGRLILVLLAGCVAIASTPTRAEAEARSSADSNSALDTVHIFAERPAAEDGSTATKTDTPIIETPQSIAVITSEEIAAQGAQTVAQTLRYAPGVTAEPRGVMVGLDYFYARGFLLNQFLDGLRTLSGEYSLPQPDPYLLERVEIVSGPASVLFGQAEPGGVLNLVSKRPTPTTSREVVLQVGSFGRVQAAVDFNGALNEAGTLSGRLTGVWKDADSQVQFASEQRLAIAPALAWKPNEDTSLTILSNYQNDPAVGYYNWTPALGSVFENPALPNGRLPTDLYTGDPAYDKWSRRIFMVGDIFELRFKEHFTLRQILRYSDASSDFRNLYASYLDPDGHTLYRYAWMVQDSATNWDSDNQLESQFTTGDVSHTLLTGLDFQWLHYRQRLGYDFATVPPLDLAAPAYYLYSAIPPLASDALQVRQQTGVYLQDQISFGNWRALLGGRYDWTRTTTTQYIGDDGNYFSGASTTDRQSAFTDRAGLLYLLDSSLAFYTSYTESFLPQSGSDFAGTPFKPTTGQQLEAGIKLQSADARRFATLAVYQLDQQNVLATDEDHPGENIQTGEIRSRGLELTGAMSFGNFQLRGSYDHLDQKVTKGNVDFGPALGNTPATMPADEAALWAEYALPMGTNQFGTALGVRYTGGSWGDDDNTFRVSGRTLVDAALRYDVGRGHGSFSDLRLALNVTNLFDKTYVSGCSGADYCGYGFRRSMLATAAKSF